jgi:hypothetical protein
LDLSFQGLPLEAREIIKLDQLGRFPSTDTGMFEPSKAGLILME